SGCGRFGRERNSGWNCEPTIQGWSRTSQISTSEPSGVVPLGTKAGFSELGGEAGEDAGAVREPVGTSAGLSTGFALDPEDGRDGVDAVGGGVVAGDGFCLLR